MANPCDPAAGEPQTGIGPIVVYDAAKLVNLFLNHGVSWLGNFLPQIGGQSYDLSSFCSGPINVPESDPGTIASYFSPLNPVGLNQLNKWLVDVANAFVFAECCKCVGGGSPDPPFVPPQPPDVNVDPPGGTPQPGVTCLTGEIFDSFGNPGVGQTIFTYPNGSFGALTGINCTSFTVQEGWGVDTAPFSFDVTYGYVNAASTFTPLGKKHVSDFALNNELLVFPLPANASYVYQAVGAFSGTGTVAEDSFWNYYCSGISPTGSPAECCPTDPNLMALIQQVLDQVNLIQRFRLPFATVPGAVHSGLTGNGTFSIPRLIGVKVTVTTIPGRAGVIDGEPDTYFDLGWVSITTPDGFIDERRVSQASFAWLSRQFPDSTTFGYSIPADTVISVQELEAEP